MKKVNTIKIFQNSYLRILSELVISIVIALLLEFAVNLPALTQGYQPFHVSEYRITKKERLIYEHTFEDAVYINKIKIRGSFASDQKYKISLNVENAFGVEEILEVNDYVYSIFSEAYTNVRKQIKTVKITFDDASQVEIEEITLLNDFVFSEYRFLFWILVCFLGLLLVVEREEIVRKTEWFYLVFALGFGLLLINGAGPIATTWDEEVHYSLIYRTHVASETVWTHAAWQNVSRFAADINTKEEMELLKAYMNQQGTLNYFTEPRMAVSIKNVIVYFPMIVAQEIGRLFRLPYVHLYNLGRIGSLLFCTMLMFIAVRLTKRKKLLVVVASVMPTVLFQSSMYTYDGMIYACMMLGFVLWANEMEKTVITLKNLVWIILLFSVGSIAKPIYVPFYILLIPLFGKMIKAKYSKRMIMVLATGIIAAVLVLAGLYIIPLWTNMSVGNVSYGGDLRGGETGIMPQWLSMKEYPGEFIKMLIHEICTLDNFRNFGAESKNRFMMGNLMFLNLYVLGILKDAWSMILIPMFMMLTLAEPAWENSSDKSFRKKMRRLTLPVMAVCVIMTWIIMYLTFTPVGSERIEGVQARYYLPLILPAAYAVWNNGIRLHFSKVRYYQIMLGAALLLTGICIYQCLFSNRLI